MAPKPAAPEAAQSGAAQPQAQQQDQALLHSAYYATSTSPIKDDVPQLAACWRTGAGALTKQEAGLLLWFHCQRGEDGCTEVLGAGVLAACLDVLASSAALAADKSTAAGLLHALSMHDSTKEQVARSKASGAAGASCTQVLHACLTPPEAVPRHVAAALASLASYPPSLLVLLRALAGKVPWQLYAGLLAASHKVAKDHATSIAAAGLCQCLLAGRQALALEAAAAGLPGALLDCMRRHKSAAAVSAAAGCLQAMCQAAPELSSQLGQLPGAMQAIVDLLGAPPPAVIAWEQEQLRQQQACAGQGTQPAPPSPAAAGEVTLQRQQWQHTSSSIRTGSSSGSSNGNAPGGSPAHVRLSEGLRGADSARSRGAGLLAPGSLVGSLGEADGGDAGGAAGSGQSAKVTRHESTLNRSRRKSLRILDVPEGEPTAAAAAAAAAGLGGSSSIGADHGAGGGAPALRSKSTLGCARPGPVPPGRGALRASAAGSCAALTVSQPPLSANSVALKWEGPVPESTRAAVAGLLAELVLQPALVQAASNRLAASRLAAVLLGALRRLADTAASKKQSSKRAAAKLAVPPEAELLLTNLVVCLEFLVAGSSADCFRVAAAGCLVQLVQLAAESRNTRLRRAAKAVVCQVVLLSEVQHFGQQAGVPEELLVLEEEQTKLTDADIRRLLLEFPTGSGLQCLDDVTARARPPV